jgi:hypothetical protein
MAREGDGEPTVEPSSPSEPARPPEPPIEAVTFEQEIIERGAKIPDTKQGQRDDPGS